MLHKVVHPYRREERERISVEHHTLTKRELSIDAPGEVNEVAGSCHIGAISSVHVYVI